MNRAQGKRGIFALTGSRQGLWLGPLALGLILVLSFYLRLYHLGCRPLYGDEPFNTVEVASRSLGQITTTNRGSTFYPLLVHLFLPLGKTEAAARLPAALFGFLSVLAIYLLARQFFGKIEGLIAAFFSSVSTYQIFFSQQARGYTGLLLFSILSLYFFWRGLHEGRVHFWVLYTLSTVIGIYFHFIFIMIIPIHAVFALTLIFMRWVQKRRKREVPSTRKISWGVVLSLFFILLLTFLLYLPVGQTPRQNSLFIYFSRGLSSFLSLELFRDPIRLMVMVIKRFLAYDQWPFFFFVQAGLALLGLISCLRSCRKTAVLFLSYWVLSFLLFVMSNPRRVYLTPPNANKFMMLLPLVFILAAKGLSAFHSFVASAISRLARIQRSPALKNALWVVIIIGPLLGEGVLLETYNAQIWQFYSLKRDGEINRYLASHVSRQEMIYFSDAPNRSDFYFVQPLPSPDTRSKKFMLFEDHVDSFITRDLSRRVGLFIVLNRSSLPGRDVSQVKALFHSDSVQEMSQYWVLHFPRDDITLYDRVGPMIDLLAGLPGIGEERKLESCLLLAKVHLLAQRTNEAWRELGRLDSLKSSLRARLKSDQESGFFKRHGLMVLSREKKSLSTRLQGLLQQKIGGLLMENAERVSLQGRIDDAIALQNEAEHLDPQTFRTSFWFHLSLGELYAKKGMKNEADSEFMEALLTRRTPREEISVLKNIRELHTLPRGFLVWKSNGICHLRWWSDERNTFIGTISSLRPIKKVRGFHLEPNDKCKISNNSLKFIGIAQNGRIEGINWFSETASRLSFLLRMDGRENIEKSVIILPGGIHPQGMPFVLGE